MLPFFSCSSLLLDCEVASEWGLSCWLDSLVMSFFAVELLIDASLILGPGSSVVIDLRAARVPPPALIATLKFFCATYDSVACLSFTLLRCFPEASRELLR